MLLRLLKRMCRPRVVNGGFMLACLASAFGLPNGPVMLVTAALYGVLVVVG